MQMKIIAVDFDGTLCRDMWPDIGEANRDIIRTLKKRRDNGDKIILWTCRSGRMLDAAVLWCWKRGLEFDAVNANLPEMIRRYGNDCRKVYADEYWDDKSAIVRFTDEASLLQPLGRGYKLTTWRDADGRTKKSVWKTIRERVARWL